MTIVKFCGEETLHSTAFAAIFRMELRDVRAVGLSDQKKSQYDEKYRNLLILATLQESSYDETPLSCVQARANRK